MVFQSIFKFDDFWLKMHLEIRERSATNPELLTGKLKCPSVVVPGRTNESKRRPLRVNHIDALQHSFPTLIQTFIYDNFSDLCIFFKFDALIKNLILNPKYRRLLAIQKSDLDGVDE